MSIFTDNLQEAIAATAQKKLRRDNRKRFVITREFAGKSLYISLQGNTIIKAVHLNNHATFYECIGKDNGCHLCCDEGKPGRSYVTKRYFCMALICDPQHNSVYYAVLQIDDECRKAIGLAELDGLDIKKPFQLQVTAETVVKPGHKPGTLSNYITYSYAIKQASKEEILDTFNLDSATTLRQCAYLNTCTDMIDDNGNIKEADCIPMRKTSPTFGIKKVDPTLPVDDAISLVYKPAMSSNTPMSSNARPKREVSEGVARGKREVSEGVARGKREVSEVVALERKRKIEMNGILELQESPADLQERLADHFLR